MNSTKAENWCSFRRGAVSRKKLARVSAISEFASNPLSPCEPLYFLREGPVMAVVRWEWRSVIWITDTRLGERTFTRTSDLQPPHSSPLPLPTRRCRCGSPSPSQQLWPCRVCPEPFPRRSSSPGGERGRARPRISGWVLVVFGGSSLYLNPQVAHHARFCELCCDVGRHPTSSCALLPKRGLLGMFDQVGFQLIPGDGRDVGRGCRWSKLFPPPQTGGLGASPRETVFRTNTLQLLSGARFQLAVDGSSRAGDRKGR